MKTIHALLLGTSRLHRSFARRVDKRLEVNIQEDVQVRFARIGYLHTAAEILQAIRFLRTPEVVPADLLAYVFRIEPRVTTPLNEFDPELEAAARQRSRYRATVDLDSLTHLVVEVSSLTTNLHRDSGTYLHANPNVLRSVPYARIYPEGYYAKFEPDMPVVRSETSVDALAWQLESLRKELPGVRVVVIGHLRSEFRPNVTRDRIHQRLDSACARAGCAYLDTGAFVDRYGFGVANGEPDLHHLSSEGEFALGQAIQDALRLG